MTPSAGLYTRKLLAVTKIDPKICINVVGIIFKDTNSKK